MEKKKTSVKDEFEICYEYLPITIWVKQYEASRYEPAEYEEREIEIDYDYSLDEDEVMDYFADHADVYEEFKQFDDTEEGNAAFNKYLEEHLDDLFDKYYDDIKEHFYESARDAAEDNYDPDDYDDSDW